MANDKKFVVKNGLTTSNIEFKDDINNGTNTITVSMLSTDTLSFSGDSGQLFSITDSLTGTIFSVNDISGIPSVEVDDDGTIRLAEFAGNVLIGTATDDGANKLQLTGNAKITGNFETTGNISVTGTVDGRDIAADGSKLDGIESGATADQTASEILTAIKTVDGAGSGLDADLLDGQQGSYYLDYNNLTNTPGSGAARTEEFPTVTNGSAAVTMNGNYAIDKIDVFLNGAKMKGGTDYTVSGTTLTFSENLQTGDVVALYVYNTDVLITADWNDLNDVSVTGASADDLVRYNGSSWVIAPASIDSSGNLTVSGYLAGPSTFTIDPAAVGDNTGTVVIAGDLQVAGTTITVNSQEVAVGDKVITLGSDATADTQNNGAGIKVYRPDSFDASFLWDETNDEWDLNTNFNISGNLTVDTNTLYVDATNNRVGIGTSSPTEELHVYGSNASAFLDAATGTSYPSLQIGGSGTPQFSIDVDLGAPTTNGTLIRTQGGAYPLRFGTNTTERMRIDSSGNVGIGTTAPASLLHLQAASPSFRLTDTTAGDYALFSHAGGNLNISADPANTVADTDIVFNLDGSEKVRIKYNGNVGIGTTSPATALDVTGTITADGLNLGDNEKVQLGASNDLQIYHDGSNSRIRNISGGELRLEHNQLRIWNTSGVTNLIAYSAGSTDLYHNGSLKLATTSTGVDVTGTVTADGLNLGDNEKILLGTGGYLEVYANGGTSYIRETGTGNLRIAGNTVQLTDASFSKYFQGSAGTAYFYHNDAQKLATTSTGVDVTGDVDIKSGNYLRLHNPADTGFASIRLDATNTVTANYPWNFTDTGTSNFAGDLTIAGDLLVGNKRVILDDDLIQAFNPFGTSGEIPKKIFASHLTDRFGGRSSELYVTKDGVEISDTDKNAIFDGSFDTSWTAASAGDADFVLNVNTVTNGLTNSSGFVYVQGTLKLAFYPGRGPDATPTARWKDSNNVYRTLTVTEDYKYGSDYIGYEISGLSGNYLTDIEITISPRSDIECRVAALEYHGDRMGLKEGPLLTTLGGTFYNVINAKFEGSETIKLTPSDGSVSFASSAFNVTGSGNVGIGTTTPAESLDVNGDAIIHGSGGTIGLSGGSWTNAALRVGGASSGLGIDANELMFYGIGKSYIGSLDNAVGFYANTAERLTLTSSGNVGIGTTSEFTVGGTARLTVAGGNLAIGSSNSDLMYIRRQGNGEFAFQTYYGGNNGNIQLNPYGGDVGIGTTTPARKLHVHSGGSGLITRLERASTLIYDIGIDNIVSGDDADLYFEPTQDNSGYLFRTRNSANNVVIGLAIDGEGNVGIGTTSPSYPLDVSGDVLLSGSLRLLSGQEITWANGDCSIIEGAHGNNYSMSFRTYDGASNTTKMHILGNGNVGIGTTSPSKTLEVNGDIEADSATFTTVTTTGAVVIGGDLTVSGTTTTVNTETINLADNIIVLNSNEAGTPSQNAGIEIERGTSTNVVLQWNETNDYWEIASGGTTGRILTTGDEGTGNGLDADTVDGIEAAALTQSGDSVALTGDVTGTTTVAADGAISIATTIAANSVALGTDTTGNYVATVSGTTNEIEVTGSGSETAGVTVGLPNDVTVSNNLSVNNNIIVSGTVDGRDVAADGSKLDGIESGATADQTASEILTAIKTVDGSGSGLDADLLDGINSGSFVRSDSNDTVSGQLTLNRNLVFNNNSTDTYPKLDNNNSYRMWLDGFVAIPKGYSGGDGLSFRFDDSESAYIFDRFSGVSYSVTAGTNPGSTIIEKLFGYTNDYFNLNSYKDASNNFEFTVSGLSLSNSSNTQWAPYVLFHSGGGSVTTVIVEGLEGDGTTWTELFNGDAQDVIAPLGFTSFSTGILKGLKFKFQGITGNSYLKMVGVTSRTTASFTWQMLKTGGEFYGDISGKSSGTGNWSITQAGAASFSTVNGRDVAADGTKLDGIEAGATADQTLGDLGITATAAEINKLDGVTATTTELNYIDGVTSNIQTQLDGKLSTTGVAAQATNLNATDDRDIAPEDLSYSDDLRIYFADKGGLETGTIGSNYQDVLVLNSYSDSSGGDANALAFDKSEKKIYHYQADQSATNWGTAKTLAYTDDISLSTLGITATAAEINKLDGVTATTAELNYIDGVTSNIQTQLDAKLNSSSYTASDVLTKIKTVDGSGSGLDADLLDGINSASFLRSDANDDFSGTLNYTPDTGTILSVDGQAILQRMTANGAITIGHDDAVIIAGGDTSSVLNTNINNATETIFLGAEGGLVIYAFPNNDTTWTNRKTLSFDGANGLDMNSVFAVDINGNLSAATKSFVIDHPTKEGMKLRHGSLEGPENGVYVRGRLTNANVIQLPDYWLGLVDEDSITVQLTAIGTQQNPWVKKIVNNTVVIEADSEIDCFYMINAERKDVKRFEVEYEV